MNRKTAFKKSTNDYYVQKNNQKGITLIALIITIIVLLILAGVTISTLTGDNGLLSKTTEARKKQEEAAALEEVKLAMEAIKIGKLSKFETVTLNTFVEDSNHNSLTLLEYELYNGDNNVSTELTNVDNEDVLDVIYKGFEFIINGDLSIEVLSNSIEVNASIANSSISSLTISCSIEEEDAQIDLSKVTEIYYSCDNGVNWRSSNKNTTYTYTGLVANKNYSVKVKALIGNKEVVSKVIVGRTASTEDNIENIPSDFFITSNGGATISGINSSYLSGGNIAYDGFDGTLVIPSEWKNVNVTAVTSLSYIYNITQLYIDEGIEEIGDNAFNSCSGLNEVTLPTTLTTIGNTPFLNCRSITKVTIPQLVISKDMEGNGYTVGDVFGTSSDQHITQVNFNGNITYIGKETFSECKDLVDIDIPSAVTGIYYRAFMGCRNLEKIVIPSSLTTLGDEAFYECKKVTNLTIPGNLETIPSGAFRSCIALRDLTIKNGVKYINSSAFSDCKALVNLKIEEGLKIIYNTAFSGCTALTEVELPASLTSVQNGAFQDCNNITKVTVPQAVVDRDKNGGLNGGQLCQVFSETACKKFTEVNFSGEVKSIGYYAFEKCNALESITLPNNLEEIGYYAFYGCTALTEVVLPSSLTTVDSVAFSGCTNLTKIMVKKAEGTLGNSPWGATNATVVWDP